jgi:hypothetical protein
MDVVRQYTIGGVGGENFCQKNSLSLSVINTNTTSVTITVGQYGTATFGYKVSKLEYESCTGDQQLDGHTGDGHRYVYELTGTTADTDSSSTVQNSGITYDGTSSNLLPAPSGSGDTVSGQSLCYDFCSGSTDPFEKAFVVSFIVVKKVNGEDIHADVQATLTIGGSPCDGSSSSTLDNDVLIGFKMIDEGASETCPDRTTNAADYITAGPHTAEIHETICADLDGTNYDVTLHAFRFKDNAVGTELKSGTTDAEFFYGGSGVLNSGEVLKVEADWSYEVTSGTRRMLRTTYLLGSSEDGESSSTIRILPAEVQVQEQIEAAGASEAADAEAEDAEDADASPAPSDDHSHESPLIWGVIGTGAGVVIIAGVMIYQATRSGRSGRRADGESSNKKGYQRVGRFQSNLAF